MIESRKEHAENMPEEVDSRDWMIDGGADGF